MKLQTLLPHMIGAAVRANTTLYQVDSAGIIDVTDEADLKLLLANTSGWKVVVERTPKAPPVVTVAELRPASDTTPVVQDPVIEPTTTMTIAQLHELADVYGINYTGKTSKQDLVNKITKAMSK